jgi:hypothetical protein
MKGMGGNEVERTKDVKKEIGKEMYIILVVFDRL